MKENVNNEELFRNGSVARRATMSGCVADYCTNSVKKGFKMCRFPRDPKRRKIWAENTRRQDWTPSDNSVLCEVYFDAEMWTESKTGKHMLKKDAVPTVFGELQNTQESMPT
ncbi:THAP domain-containing protein 2 [Acromyrmex echinatior]|uniref:THAP domain-containing protein 2 n=1 Tax=Acromyrmex echinatior TaxID=103372 RepID=F4W8Z2_ACREC|nr:THAP domain-containing protein 2 [Acromyrmex echinatior]